MKNIQNILRDTEFNKNTEFRKKFIQRTRKTVISVST